VNRRAGRRTLSWILQRRMRCTGDGVAPAERQWVRRPTRVTPSCDRILWISTSVCVGSPAAKPSRISRGEQPSMSVAKHAGLRSRGSLNLTTRDYNFRATPANTFKILNVTKHAFVI